MKRNGRTILVVAAAFMLLAVTPAMAGRGAHRMSGAFDGATVGFNPDPVAVAERCPDGYGWILQSGGTVEMRSAVYHGEAMLTAEHCSRWLTPPVEKALGQIGEGFQTLTTPDGDELWFVYSGFWKFRGDLEGEFSTTVTMRYAIYGGTGIFENASGTGRFVLEGDQTDAQWGKMKGTLFVPKG
jgi:hypothetical protein